MACNEIGLVSAINLYVDWGCLSIHPKSIFRSMSMPYKILSMLLGLFVSASLYGQSPIEDYNSSKTYATGSLVLVGQSSYISIQSVPAGNTPPNTTYWTDLSIAAANLSVPVETVPSLDTSTILASLPGSAPDTNSSSSSTFFGLALRGYSGTYPVAGGMTITGSTSKKVMIRVKGSSMNFSGTKLSDPKITITKYNASTSTYDSFLTVDNWGDHASTATNYADRATSDSKEPVAVVDMDPGTYGVRVEDAAGGTGNANVEFYGLADDTGTGRFYGLALRAEVGANPVAGGITISGTGSKKVMIRVKGSTMSFGGAKLNDPKITITKYNSSTSAYESFLTVDNWGDHASTATNYASRATSDTKEPVAVVDMDPGTYGVRVEDAAGGTGSANVEFYEVE